MNRVSLLTVFLLSVLPGTGCQSRPENTEKSDKIHVVTSIFPIADVTRHIAGEEADVTCLLQAGSSPHDFQPSPSQVETLAQADLIIVVGEGIDPWALPQEGEALTRQTVLKLAAGLNPHEHEDHEEDADHGHHHHGHHHHGEGDPHLWLDPVRMQQFTQTIADTLSEIDPAHRDAYQQRAQAYIAQLKQLDEQYRQTLERIPNKNFVTFHPAFTYIAERYGLNQRSLLTADAEGFGPERLESLAKFIRDNRIKAIFAEPQFPADRLEAFARETGASVGRLDPLGSPHVEGYNSYLDMMRSNLDALAEGLKQ
jgi:ABC-type Zn uptake system ZnuABC Zn-binding protein ZnuA